MQDTEAGVGQAVEYLSKAHRLCKERPAGVAGQTPMECLAMRAGVLFELAEARAGVPFELVDARADFEM